MMLRVWRKESTFARVGEIVTWYSHCGKQYDKSSENKELPYNPAFPHMDIYPKEIRILTCKDTCTTVLITALFAMYESSVNAHQ